jgi:hypothetical protein
MDDDDYYPPETLIARVKPLIGYKGVNCVGCSRVGVYDIVNDKSYISSDGHISLSEASMAYTKKFWEEQNFDPGCERGEYRSFIMNRLDQILDMPYIFVICATNHGRNFTPRTEWLEEKDPSKETIRNAHTGKEMNFPDMWDEEATLFVKNLRKYILNSQWMSQKNNAELSTESIAELSTESIAESIAELSAELSTESIAELSTESIAESIAELSAELSTESIAELSTESIAESIAELSAELSTDIV